MPFGTIPLNDGRNIPAIAFGTCVAIEFLLAFSYLAVGLCGRATTHPNMLLRPWNPDFRT